jgi:seryl-tRNA synthetase
MECIVSLEGLAASQHGQLKYAAAFIDEQIRDIRLEDNHIYITHESPKGNEVISNQVRRLMERFSNGDFGFKENILFEHKVTTPYEGDIIAELVELKIIKVLEAGLFIFREPFSSLMRFFDYSFVTKIANRFTGIKEESYPAVIHCETLNKTNHFTSFPEHIHFVSHLREDLDIIEAFSQSIRDAGGWRQDAQLDLNTNMPMPKFTMNPSTCYHCYEGLQNETLEGDGIIVSAISKCHRFESRNHSDFGRLLDFSMREIIFVGKPEFVKENRLRSIEYIKELAVEWNVDSMLEIANDPFFTNDFQTKAAFQRNQEMKYELRLTIPHINKSIACSSVNFHSNTFGNAFQIKMSNKRPAVTGCVGFGIERWVFAFLAQYGLNETDWPDTFRSQYHAWQQKSL